MKRWRFIILLAIPLVLAVIAAWPGIAQRPEEANAPEVFSSPINGGCYIAASGECRIHVDPFTINVGSGRRLVAFELQANGQTIYSFRTDVSNPPPFSGTTYTPSLVALDFAATCGEEYSLNIIGRDSGDMNFLNMGQTAAFTCPSNVP